MPKTKKQISKTLKEMKEKINASIEYLPSGIISASLSLNEKEFKKISEAAKILNKNKETSK